jgi:hypothetical protein
MTDVVTFLGLGRGNGNATMARAFAISTAGSNECVLVEADRTDDTTFDWAIRRKATRSYGHVAVRQVAVADCLSGQALEIQQGIVILQTAYSSDAVATELAQRSRLTVLTARPGNVNTAENLLRVLINDGISPEAIAILLCEPDPNIESTVMEKALAGLSAAGIRAHGVPFLGRHMAGPLREKGWTIEESARPLAAQEAEGMIGFLQTAYLDAPENGASIVAPIPRLPAD